MKILQINSVYKFGSTGRIASDLKTVIEKNCGECAIIYGRGDVIDKANVWKIGSELDFRFHVLFARLTDKAGFYSKEYTKKMIEQIQIYNPDIIHLHNIHGYYVNVEMLFDFLKEYKRAVVWTLHDTWSFTGHCSHYEAVGCEKWKTQCGECPQIREYPKSFVDNSAQNYMRKKKIFIGIDNLTIVTPSFWLQQQIQQSFLQKYECKTIANGIDLQKFSPLIKTKDKNKFIILGVASVWGERKGFNDFIRLSKYIDLSEYQIIMVGVNNQQKQILAKHNIVAIERTNSIEELVQLYSQADIFLNLTYEDTFPTTNLEALACGTPILTYRTGGSPESLNSNCGIIVEKGDLSSVIEHLKQLRKKNFDSQACINQANYFNKFDKFQEYINLYQEILSNS
ncbi:glycosyltransferase [Alysiella crassa]|uniref:Putative glycosyl transferase n=1 Tax=Alysiella crassa TaxID=153491 RepID=A0A376BSV1_9NEIS|nr:glycosyltransferase [Alysiella crassa]UOP08005.1 glycosyltransferase [Alysiella crassa]SSY80077.1 putative glycosyl transferase [Alysiella crassa]